MAHADVIDFVQLIGVDADIDGNTIERYYTDAVRDLGHATDHLTNITLITGVADQAVYTSPAPTVRILSAFYGQRELWTETYVGLASSIGPTWRERQGEPLAFTTLDTADNSIRLFPVPTIPGQDFLPLTGLFGASYPDFNVFVAHTEERTDVPDYLELFLALTILSREYSRDSAHQDLEFASAASSLAGMVFTAVN